MRTKLGVERELVASSNPIRVNRTADGSNLAGSIPCPMAGSNPDRSVRISGIEPSATLSVRMQWLTIMHNICLQSGTRSGCSQSSWNASASSVKIGTIQRRLAWPLRKDDTQKSRMYHFLVIERYSIRCFAITINTSILQVVLVGVVGNISACHADARGSIPRRGAFLVLLLGWNLVYWMEVD